MNPPPRIDIDELKELANGQVRQLARELLPNGREAGGYWEIGSIEGERGQSLKLNLQGANRGLWTDFSSAKGSRDYSGNMVQLVAQVKFGGNVGEACLWLTSWLGLDGLDPERLATRKAEARKAAEANAGEARAAKEKTRGRALNLFLSGVPIPGTPAETYLVARGIDLRASGMAAPGSLRFHPECWCSETKTKLPAMLAAVVGLDGRHLGTHRTYLLPDGSDKAQLAEPKKSWGSITGGFIPLWKGRHRCSMFDLPPGTPVYASEGIEDGLSVALVRPDERIVAGVSLSNMGGMELPAGSPLYILGQRDTDLRPIEAFEAMVVRHQERGRDVWLLWPPEGYKDYNEPLDRRRAHKAAA